MVRKIRAKLVLELRAQGLSARAIAAGQGISRNSIASVMEAADRLNIRWEDVGCVKFFGQFVRGFRLR